MAGPHEAAHTHPNHRLQDAAPPPEPLALLINSRYDLCLNPEASARLCLNPHSINPLDYTWLGPRVTAWTPPPPLVPPCLFLSCNEWAWVSPLMPPPHPALLPL